MPEFSNIEIPGYTLEDGPFGGGMAYVYIALQQSTRRRVAIKIIQPKFIESGDTEQYITRFKREAVFQANLTDPYIATLYELGVVQGLPFIVMEYLPGGDLEKKIKSAKPDAEGLKSVYTLREGLRYIKQVAHALQSAHEKGVVHRDIKPANIMFRHNGDAVLTDFGIAKATENASLVEDITRTRAQFAMGTPRYMSPEQIKASPDEPVDARSDLYSLGATLYYVLTGRPPYVAESAMAVVELHFNGEIPALPKPLAHYDELIQKTLAKDPDERYASAKEFVEYIEKLEKSHPAKTASCLDKPVTYVDNTVVADSKATTKKFPKKKKQSPWLFMAGGALPAALLFAGLYFFIPRVPPAPAPDKIELSVSQRVLNEKVVPLEDINAAFNEIQAVLNIDAENKEALSALDQLRRLYKIDVTEMIYHSQFSEADQWLKGIHPDLLTETDKMSLESKRQAELERIAKAEQEETLRTEQENAAKAEQERKVAKQREADEKAEKKALENALAQREKARAAAKEAARQKEAAQQKEIALRKEAERQKALAVEQEQLKQKDLARQQKIAKQKEQQQQKAQRRIDELLAKAHRVAGTGQPRDLNAVVTRYIPDLKSVGLAANSAQMNALLEKVKSGYKQNADRLVVQGREAEALSLLKGAQNIGVKGLDTASIEQKLSKKKAQELQAKKAPVQSAPSVLLEKTSAFVEKTPAVIEKKPVVPAKVEQKSPPKVVAPPVVF